MHFRYQTWLLQFFLDILLKTFGSLMIFFKKDYFFPKILWNGRVAVVVQDYLVEHQQWWRQVVVVEDVSERKRAKILVEVLLDPALPDIFFILRHISSIIFCQKLYSFYLLGKLSLRATQSLWNGNNWRTSIVGSENNKRIYISDYAKNMARVKLFRSL